MTAGCRAGYGRSGAATRLNALAVGWLAFETVNIAWPRRSLAPPGAPDYQVWAAPLFIGAVVVLGLPTSSWPARTGEPR